ncbi:BSD domain-containing protein [Histoplasma capsulatum]|nr:BSD domain-containing protein [Histoplasma capsulatum]
MPPKTNTLQNSNRLDKLSKLDKPLRKTSKQTTRQEARRARPLSRSRIDRERQYRLALGGNTRNQKTLTQIDFVKQAQALLARGDKDEDDDLELEYIGGETWDGDYEVPVQSSKRRKRNGNGRRANTGQKFGSDLGGRKQVDETDGSDDDKTLTQMGYVTGWQNDGRSHNMHAGLGKRKGVDQMENIGKEPKAKMCDGTLQESRANCDNRTGTQGRKRKLSEVNSKCHSSQIVPPSSLNLGGNSSARTPVTPRKPINRVVPSSQSPDSPALILLPCSLKESPPKFPLAPLSHNVTPRKTAPPSKGEYMTPICDSQLAQYEIPVSPFNSASTGSPNRCYEEESVIELRSTHTTSPPFAPEKDSDKKLSKSPHSIAKQTTPKDQKTEPGDPDTISFDAEKSKKRVIYETDAETEDEEIHLSCKEHHSWRTQTQVIHDSSSRSRNDDYYDDYPLNELPTQARNSDQETCDTLPKNILDSEASMLYYRKPMSLSFEPGSELANINTQRLAELFPAAETEYEKCVIPHLSTIPEKHEAEEDSVDHASTTRPTKNSSTNHISNSPRRQPPLNTTAERSISPPSSPPVVLVESSQQSDMGDADPNHTAYIDSQNDCQCLVTTSQLLTDSMMESVSGPSMWMSSHDPSQEEYQDTAET